MAALKILGYPASSMYIWAIALISFLVAVSSYTVHAFPLGLAVAAILASVIDILIRKYYLKHRLKFPFSGLITGLIIGSVAPINAPLLLILIAVAIAIASKFLIQYRHSNIFNPSALGLIVALAVFGLGDEWWVASNYNIYGIAVSLTPLLIILPYEAKRMPTALSFVAVSLVLDLIFGGFRSASFAGVLALLFSLNYFFAFVMLVDPKTSPNNNYVQMGYGSLIALLYFAFAFYRIPYSLLSVLLVGNLFYLLYRRYGRR